MNAPLNNDQLQAIHQLIQGTENESTRPTLMLNWRIDQGSGKPAACWEVVPVRTPLDLAA